MYGGGAKFPGIQDSLLHQPLVADVATTIKKG